jgi:hypothetical protein
MATDVVLVPPAKLHLYVDLSPIGSESRDPDSSTQERWPKVDECSQVTPDARVHGGIVPQLSPAEPTPRNVVLLLLQTGLDSAQFVEHFAYCAVIALQDNSR